MQLNEYKNTINQLLSEFCPHSFAFSCDNINCDSSSHFRFLDSLFNFIISVILIASLNLKNNSTCSEESIRKKIIPGWNKYIKDYYNKARLCFLNWKFKGREINTAEHSEMLSSRRKFKSALNFCKKIRTK